MPLAVLETRCRLGAWWHGEGALGTSATTTLRGLLGEVLAGNPAYGEVSGWLHATPSRWHPSQIASRLQVTADCVSNLEWKVRLVVRGAASADNLALLRQALEESSRRGFLQDGRAILFDVAAREWEVRAAEALLEDRVALLGGRRSVGLQFVTPCCAPSLECADLAGNLAASMAKLHRAVEANADQDKRSIDREADVARSSARQAFDAVSVREGHWEPPERGMRRSGTTGQRIPLEGRRGFVVLVGDLSLAAPWLALMELHGVGTHTAFGAGRVALWHRIDG